MKALIILYSLSKPIHPYNEYNDFSSESEIPCCEEQ